MPRHYKTGSYKKERSSGLGGVSFYGASLPKDPEQRLKVLIKKEINFIKQYPNYIQMCLEAKKRIAGYRLELKELKELKKKA